MDTIAHEPSRHDDDIWRRHTEDFVAAATPTVELSASAERYANSTRRRSLLAHTARGKSRRTDNRRPLLHKLWRALTRGTVLGAILMTLTLSACGTDSYNPRSTPTHADNAQRDATLRAREAEETQGGRAQVEAHAEDAQDAAETGTHDDTHALETP